MEDSHIASPGLLQKEDSPVSLFGVFDGHGGKVALENKITIDSTFSPSFDRKRSSKICEIKVYRFTGRIGIFSAWRL